MLISLMLLIIFILGFRRKLNVVAITDQEVLLAFIMSTLTVGDTNDSLVDTKCQRNSWHLPYTLSMSFILCTCKSNGHSFQQKKKENRKLHETQI